MGKLVNQIELAEIIGKSTVTIWEWQDQGFPIKKRGAGRDGHEYDTAEVLQWLVDQALAREGRSKTVIERQILELELKEKQRKDAVAENSLVPAEQVRPIWEQRVLAAAAFMMSRASRLAGELEAAPGIEAKRTKLRESDADFLTRLGVHGEAIQDGLDAFLQECPTDQVRRFFDRIGLAATTQLSTMKGS